MAERRPVNEAPGAVGSRRRRGDAGSTSLEVVLLVPVLMLLALFVLWAGRGGRAALITDLAAEEAAVAASLACEDGTEAACEELVRDVLEARPGLDFLCIGGPRPAAGSPGLLESEWLGRAELEVDPADTEVSGVGVLGVRFVCETDGAVAPLRGVFPTVSFHGQASEVAILQGPPKVGIADAQVHEAQPELVFRLTLDAPLVGDVTVPVTVTGGSYLDGHATEIDDYTVSAPDVTIRTGDTAAEFRVNVVPDNLYEVDETFEVELGDPSDPALLNLDQARRIAIGTILNDDAPPALTMRDPSPVTEGPASTLDFEVTLAATGADAVVQYRTDDGTATEANVCQTVVDPDYQPIAGPTLRFPASTSDQTQTVSVTVDDDLCGEGPETVELWLDNVTGAQLAAAVPPDCVAVAAGGTRGDDCAVGVIIDDEPGLRIDDAEACESSTAGACGGQPMAAGTLTFTVTRFVPPGQPHPAVTVRYSTVRDDRPSADPAEHPVDYTAAAHGACTATSPQVRIAAGTATTTVTIPVALVDDALDEPPETFMVELCDPSDNAWIGTGRGVGTIQDDDAPPEVTVSDATVQEAVGAELQFDVALTAASAKTVTVEYWTEDHTAADAATAAADYLQVQSAPPSARGRVVFNPGDTGPEQAIVELVDDSLDENDETLWLRLQAFNATLDAPANPAMCEPEPPGPGTDEDSCAVGTITDDDDPPYVVVSDDVELENGTLSFRVELVDDLVSDVFSAKTVTVDYQVFHGTTEAADFDSAVNPLSGTLVFDPTDPLVARRRATAITLTPERDTLDEHDETFTVRLSLPTGSNAQLFATTTPCQTAAVQDDCAVGTIQDDDDPPYVVITGAPVSADEGDPFMEFIVALVDAPGLARTGTVSGRDLTVRYQTVQQGTLFDHARAGVDFAAVPGRHQGVDYGEITIGAGIHSGRLRVPIIDDDIDEIDETLDVELVTPQPGDNVQLTTVPGNLSREGTIIDDDITELRFVDGCTTDPAPGTAPVPNYDACQREDTTPLSFIIGLFNPNDVDPVTGNARPTTTGENVTVGYRILAMTNDRVATENVDFQLRGTQATIIAGTSDTTIDLDVLNDPVFEHDEVFQLEIFAITGVPLYATMSNHIAVGAITNDDGEPTLTVADPASVVEGDMLQFSLELNGAIGRPVTATYETEVQTVAGAASAGTQCAAVYPATGTPDYVQVPPTTLTFNPRAPHPVTGTVPVSITEQVEVETCPDGLYEDGSETLALRISTTDGIAALTAGAAPCEPQSATGTDSDDCAVGAIDDADPRPTVVVTGGGCATDTTVDVCAQEGDPLTFTAELVDSSGDPAPSSQQITATYTVSGTATAGSGCPGPTSPDLDGADYLIDTSPTVTFDPQATEVDFEIPTCDDGIDEDDETLNVELAGANGADIDATPVSAKIIDGDDPPEVDIVDEDDNGNPLEISAVELEPLTFTIRLDRPSAKEVTVDYYTHDLTATGGDDYTPVPATPGAPKLTFTPGDPLEQQVTVATLEDDDPEGDETLQLRLGIPQNADRRDWIAEGTITDACIDPFHPDSVPPELSFREDTVEVAEDAARLVFTVETGAFCEDVLLHSRLSTGTAGISDFQFSTVNRSLSAGVTSLEFPVFIREDEIYEGGAGTFEDFTIHLNWSSASPFPQQYRGLADIVATGRIEDNDDPPVLAFVDECTGDSDPDGTADACGPEGGDITFTVGRSGETSLPAVVQYFTRGLTADPGDDYQDQPEHPAESRHTLEIGPTVSSGTISVAAVDDGDGTESPETFQMWLANPSDADIGEQIAVGRIDPPCIDPTQEGVEPPTLTPAVTAISVAEGNTSASIVVVELSQPLCSGAFLRASVTAAGDPGPGIAGPNDMQSLGASGFYYWQISAGSRTVPMPGPTGAYDDDIYEGVELATLAINWAPDRPGSQLASQYHNVDDVEVEITILDQDDPPELSVADAGPVNEDVDLEFVVSLDGPSALPVRVRYWSNELTGGDAATEGDDYVPVGPATLVLPATATEDNGVLVGTSIIHQVDPAAATVTVATIADSIADEGVERLQLEAEILDNPGAGPTTTAVFGGGGRLGTGRIRDGCIDPGDPVHGRPDVQFTPLRVHEDAGVVEYELSVSCTDADTVSWGLTFSPSAGDAAAVIAPGSGPTGEAHHFPEDTDSDVAVTRSRTVEVPGRESSGIFGRMAVNDDDVHEGDETLELRVHWVGDVPSHWDSGQWFFTVTIADDDPRPRVSVDDAETIEGNSGGSGGQMEFTVSLDRPSVHTITVDYETAETPSAGDSAAAGGSECASDADFVHTSDTVTFDPGDTVHTVPVALCPDDDVEEDEQFQLRLDDPVNADRGDDIAVGTIIDDDECISTTDDPPQWSAATGFADFGPYSFYYASHWGVAVEPRPVWLAFEIDRPLCVGVRYRAGALVAGTDPPETAWEAGCYTGMLAGTASRQDYNYCQGAGTLHWFPPGETVDYFAVSIYDDDDVEPLETFVQLVWWTTAAYNFGDHQTLAEGWLDQRLQLTGTIIDDDDPQVTVANVEAVEAAEDAGEMVFVLDLDPPTQEVAVVRYRTADQPSRGRRAATPDADYTHVDGQLTIPVGSGRAEIAVPIIDDEIEELDETFLLRLAAVDEQGGVSSTLIMEDPYAQGTILDDDAPLPAMSVSVGDGVFEGDPVVFTVALTEDSEREVTVEYLTVDGTAAAGSDYTAPSRDTLIFSPGETVKTVQVATLTGGGAEGTEQFSLRLENEVNASVADADREAAATIYDIENPPQAQLSVSDASAAEGASLQFAVRLDPPSLTEVTLPYSTVDGTATAGSDYTAVAAGSATIPARGRSAAISVETLRDADTGEGDETMTLSFGTATGATSPTGSATGTIVDGPPVDAPEVSVSDAAAAVAEGEELTFTVSISPAPQAAVTVQWRTADVTATAASGDYTAVADGSVTFDVGDTAKTITVQTLTDDERELDETLMVELVRAADNAADIVGRSGVGTITGELVVISVHDGTADEEDDRHPRDYDVDGGQITVSLSRATTSDVPFYLTFESQDALQGYIGTGHAAFNDFFTRQGCRIVPAGQTSVQCEILTHDDTRYEGTETAAITLTVLERYCPSYFDLSTCYAGTDYAVVGDARATLSITEDELPPQITAINPSIQEDSILNLEVSLQGSHSDRTVAVSWATVDGTAVAGSDYTAGSGPLTFAPADTANPTGVRTQSIAIPILADTDDTEGEEVFYVRLYNPSHATLDGDDDNDGEIRVEVRISDPPPCVALDADPDDWPDVTLLSGPSTISEGDGGNHFLGWTFQLSAPFCEDTDYYFTAESGTATVSLTHPTPSAGADLLQIGGSLGSLDAGDTTGEFGIVSVIDDNDIEEDEWFTLTMRFELAEGSLELEHVVTIEDNDNQPSPTVDCVDIEDSGHDPPTITIEPRSPSDGLSANEGEQVAMVLRLSRPFCQDWEGAEMTRGVRADTAGANPAEPEDVRSGWHTGYIGWGEGKDDHPWFVRTEQDTLLEGNETFEFWVNWNTETMPEHYHDESDVSAILTILDDDD